MCVVALCMFCLTHNATGCVMHVVAFIIFGLQPVALCVWLHYVAVQLAVCIVCRREKLFASTM